MSALSPALLEAALDHLADLVARRVVELQSQLDSEQAGDEAERSPWMGIEKAAAYLDWPKQRLYKLTASGAIPHFKQEGRLLFHRSELEGWLRSFAEGKG